MSALAMKPTTSWVTPCVGTFCRSFAARSGGSDGERASDGVETFEHATEPTVDAAAIFRKSFRVSSIDHSSSRSTVYLVLSLRFASVVVPLYTAPS